MSASLAQGIAESFVRLTHMMELCNSADGFVGCTWQMRLVFVDFCTARSKYCWPSDNFRSAENKTRGGYVSLQK